MLNKVACSYYNSAAITKKGDLYIWGSSYGKLLGLEVGLVQVSFSIKSFFSKS